VQTELQNVVDVRALNPLTFWHKHKGNWPKLQRLTKAVPAIPASSADSERLFLKSGVLITPRRNRMTADTAEELVLLPQ
jgi:hypothetical protein